MRASMDGQVMGGDRFIIKGIIPLATSMRHTLKVDSLSKERKYTLLIGKRENIFLAYLE